MKRSSKEEAIGAVVKFFDDARTNYRQEKERSGSVFARIEKDGRKYGFATAEEAIQYCFRAAMHIPREILMTMQGPESVFALYSVETFRR